MAADAISTYRTQHLSYDRAVAECFCGCGRKVRLANKRLSQWAYEAADIVDGLERFSRPLTVDRPNEHAHVEALIEQGQQFASVFKGIIHGELQAPPTMQGMDYRRAHDRWRLEAIRIAAGHTRQFNEQRAEQAATWSANERLLDRFLGPISREDALQNIEEMKRRHRDEPLH